MKQSYSIDRKEKEIQESNFEESIAQAENKLAVKTSQLRAKEELANKLKEENG